ncbi:unnamed protein product [Cladocopium goreaui]|uniref:Uncharacterized protein n=1 Tax=Cladocopium goreaui TaxID=2562237 RepID=A0A9P1CZH0_9DINO|nr:unnamed protein product [Cladocopium goreaui]
MAAVAFRLAWLLVVDVTRIAAIRDMETSETSETASAASDLVEALENRENRGFSAGPPVDLDGTVAKKGWECGKPEKDVPNRELVKNAKRKAQYLIYKWLKKEVCPLQHSQFWRAMRPWDNGKQERGELCKSTITDAEDSLGCMHFKWELDEGNCGWHDGRDRRGRPRIFPTIRGKATVLCSDIMNATVLKSYPLDHWYDSDNIAWFHV